MQLSFLRCRAERRTILINVAMMALLCASAPLVGAAVDVRVLIDVSGSMKKNDPANLRVPATRLLTELLPQEARAGIWLFGEKVEPLLPPRTVNDAWKDQARQILPQIHSRGLFTDIEQALQAASRDWLSEPANDTERHIILLTDGVVDVSKNPSENAASRQRILASLIAQLKTAGAKIHTIALSSNADHELMEAMASNTEGWREQIADAATLQRVFLHMFEQAAAPDTLPLEGNRFSVDASIHELTLLVFHGSNTAVTLYPPGGASVTAAQHDASIKWQSDAGYDLITIDSPAVGDWRIKAPEDPDNRVMIVTDLELEIDELPTSLLTDETVSLKAYLTEQNVAVKRPDFLKLISASGTAISGSGNGDLVSLALDDAAGQFHGEIPALPPGDYEIVIRADGGTFQRERRRRLRVHASPIDFRAEIGAGDDAQQALAITVQVDPDLVETQSIVGLVSITQPDQQQQIAELPAFHEGVSQHLVAAPLAGSYRLNPLLVVKTSNGRTLRIRPQEVELTATRGAAPEVEEVESAADSSVTPAQNPAFAAAVIGGGNLGVGILLGGIWLALRRKSPTQKAAQKSNEKS